MDFYYINEKQVSADFYDFIFQFCKINFIQFHYDTILETDQDILDDDYIYSIKVDMPFIKPLIDKLVDLQVQNEFLTSQNDMLNDRISVLKNSLSIAAKNELSNKRKPYGSK